MDAETWKKIGLIRERQDNKLDETGIDLQPRDLKTLRITSVGDEMAQTFRALAGALAVDEPGAWADVADELCDTAVACLVAVETMVPDADGAFEKRLYDLLQLDGPDLDDPDPEDEEAEDGAD
ncbi:hypothetical protein ABZ543_07940 [Streptomyces roseifaciens]